LVGSYVVLKDEEVFWIGANIPPYQPRNIGSSYDPERSRKILLKKSEIKFLLGKARQKGLTLIPLKVYTVRGKIKLEFAIVKGKRKFDKRDSIKKRDVEREIERELKR
jgi:SsrA-binding protein